MGTFLYYYSVLLIRNLQQLNTTQRELYDKNSPAELEQVPTTDCLFKAKSRKLSYLYLVIKTKTGIKEAEER